MSKILLKSYGETVEAPFVDDIHAEVRLSNQYNHFIKDSKEQVISMINYEDIFFDQSSDDECFEDCTIIDTNNYENHGYQTYYSSNANLKKNHTNIQSQSIDNSFELPYLVKDDKFYDSYNNSFQESDFSPHDADEINLSDDLCNIQYDLNEFTVVPSFNKYDSGFQNFDDEFIEECSYSSIKNCISNVESIDESYTKLNERRNCVYVNYIYKPFIRLIFCSNEKNIYNINDMKATKHKKNLKKVISKYDSIYAYDDPFYYSEFNEYISKAEDDSAFSPLAQSTQLKQRHKNYTIYNNQTECIPFAEETSLNELSNDKSDIGYDWLTYVTFGVAIAAAGIALVYLMKKCKGATDLMTKGKI